MDKREFLTRLRAGLAGHVTAREVNRLCTYYAAMIDDLMAQGQSEADAVAAMGSVGDLVYAAVAAQPRPAHQLAGWQWLVVIITAPLWGPMLVALAALGLAAEAVFWCVPFTSGCVALGLMLGGIWAGLLSVPASFAALFVGVSQLGVGLMMLGGGLLLGWLTWQVAKYASLGHRLVFKQLAQHFTKQEAVA